jgi:hypothetical protein
VEQCASSSSSLTSLGGEVHQGLGVRHGLMDFHMAVVLSGAMVASMAVLARSIHLSMSR